ncbi:MAG TPA: response regulator [Pyrinomonadaceae bacterium]|nr:response regulator [Pyrinomonadaceae bacterium]
MSKRKLLLADDSITIQKVVNLTFADEGIDVVTVGDGDAALAHLASETPDILLADVNMPGPTGYEICEQLRANEATRGVPVILLVGSFEPFDEAEATRVGANAYLTKPFQSIKQLIAQVNELMDASHRVDPEAPTEVPNVVEPSPVIEVPAVVEEPVAVSSQPETTASEARVFDDLGYEVHAPAAEASTTTVPAPDDIENLYEQSLSGDSNEDLSDVGIDDEMIETSYSVSDANNDLAAFAAESTTAGEAAETPSEPITAEPEAPPATPSVETEFGFRPEYEKQVPEDPSNFENTISYENWQPADMRDRQAESATLTPLDTAPLNETGPQPVEAAAPPPTVGEDTIRMENRFDTTGAAFKFDDVDLLDLSPSAEDPIEITSPANAVEQGGNKQVVTLSPELIEMIAQRVVEKLSEKY